MPEAELDARLLAVYIQAKSQDDGRRVSLTQLVPFGQKTQFNSIEQGHKSS